MSIANRLTKLEQRQSEQPQDIPQVIEIIGTRPDGTQYVVDRFIRDESGKYIEVKNDKQPTI